MAFSLLHKACYTKSMFDEPAKEVEAFSVVKRAKSFKHAFRGIYVLMRTEHNMWLHVLAAAITIFLGFFFKVSPLEWVGLITAMGIVVVAEAFNTAIEFDMDLTSPEYHPFARDTKDVAAAAVLLAVITSVAIGLVILLPKIIAYFH